MVLTRKRDLRTGTPLWLAKPPRLIIDRSLKGISTDVVVIGTGISGALTADALQQAGYSVLAVDRRSPMKGSTPASTALLQSEIDTPLAELQRKIGNTDAARVWWRSAQAVGALVDRIIDLQIPCDLRPRTTIYLAGNILNVEGLKHETEARQALGLRSVFIGRKALVAYSGLDKAGAILTDGNAEADPVKLVAGIWRHFLKNGGRMVSNTEIIDVEQSRSNVRLKTADNQHIHAKHVVFCTGYELMKFAKPKGYRVISTWVLATKPQPAHIWRSKSLIWEAADPYLYLRSTVDGRIIAGGEDEPFSEETTRDKLIPSKIAAIARKAQRLFPNASFEADYSWAGCFGESPNGLPAVGPIKGLPRCYAVLGFGGNGITFSMLAAQLISRHIQNIKDPDAELFML
jgi:glycine/D-amino acid oxidase-like deaminating enzyme